MSKIKTILAFAALMLCGAAWAIPSYVVWDQDFSQLTKNGVTLSINGNNVGNDDSTCLKITNDSTADAPQGLTLMGGFSSTKLTVVVAYKNLTLDSNYKTLVTMGLAASSEDAAGVAVSLGETRGVYQSGYYGNTAPGLEAVGEDDTEQVIAYVQDNQDRTGAKAYARNSDGSWTQFLNYPGLTYTGKSIDRIAIGGVARKGANFASNPVVPATGMVVTRIAVVTGELTADQLAEFDWTYTTEIFEGKLPTESDCERFVSPDWRGMVWIKDYGVTKFQNGYEIVNSKLDNLSRYGNENSTVKFSGVRAYTPQETVECPYELILDNDKYQYAWKNDSGWSSGARHTFAKLSGSGKFLDAYPICTQPLVFTDWSAFTGSFDIKGKRITLGGTVDAAPGQIAIGGEDPATIAANTSWAAAGGILANGSLLVPSTAPQKWLSESLQIAADGVVTVDRTDWINYSVTADKTIDVRGTLDLGTKRQTLGAKNVVRIYPGALIKGSEAADGGCHLNFYKSNAASSYCKLSMVPDGEKTDEAEISAVIGPQEAELTIDVAQNLTLNLSAAASCSFPTRQKGLIKTGEGVLKVTGHYDTLASLTLNGGTIEVYDGAKIPATVDTTVPDMRVAEETSGGKTTYTLVEKSVAKVDVLVQPCEGTTITGVESGTAYEGDTLSFTVAVADGYNADSLVVKNGESTLRADDAGVYSVVVGTSDVTITTAVDAVPTAEVELSVSADYATAKVYQDGIEITGDPITVVKGSTVDVTFTANAGYCFDDFTTVKTVTVTADANPTVVVGPAVIAGQAVGDTAYAVTKDGVCTIFGTGVATELPENIDCSSLTGVIVADGITEIGQQFFKGCLTLESIKIANPDFDMDSLANAIVYQAAIDAHGKVYTIPRIDADGYEEVLYGKVNLTDGEWTKIGPVGSVTMENSGCHFFQVRLEKGELK